MKYLYRALFYPARLYWFVVRPVVYGVGAIINEEDKVLMVRQTYGDRDMWHFPGGGKKKKENALEAIIREIEEELGLKVSLAKLGEFEDIAEHRRIRSTCFYGQFNHEVIVIDKKEIEEAKWWSLNNMPKNMSSVARASLKLYIDAL